MTPFHGSYQPRDVTFLLKPVTMDPIDITQKEHAIQSGTKHYSEMLSEERTPDARYMGLFHRALDLNETVFANDVARLATSLAQHPGEEVVLVSLARAGTPIGVLLHRALHQLGRRSIHYSISIIRDRGLDANALDYILQNAGHRDTDVVFVDGWTGKGAISDELASSVSEYNARRGARLDPTLVVVADLAGVAGLAATSEDYIIPSAILNATVSGLVSRSVLNDRLVGPKDFHACVFYAEKQSEDLSCYFVDRLSAAVSRALTTTPTCVLPTARHWHRDQRPALKHVSDRFLAETMERYSVSDRNRVKPGVGESTRALLRRVPDRLLVRDAACEHVEHLVELATIQGVPVGVDSNLPYRAAVIIKSLGH